MDNILANMTTMLGTCTLLIISTLSFSLLDRDQISERLLIQPHIYYIPLLILSLHSLNESLPASIAKYGDGDVIVRQVNLRAEEQSAPKLIKVKAQMACRASMELSGPPEDVFGALPNRFLRVVTYHRWIEVHTSCTQHGCSFFTCCRPTVRKYT